MDAAIAIHSVVASGVETLKWLRTPAAAAPTMITISTPSRTAVAVPAHHAIRRPRWSRVSSQASDTE